MENAIKPEYLKITDLHFAVWNMIKPIHFIWVDFAEQCVRCGVKDEADDPVKKEREEQEAEKEAFVELISYDTDGTPILGFDSTGEKKQPYASYPAGQADLLELLAELQRIDMFSWRNQFPSLREGLCWRIDVYSESGTEKHMSGQTRFPPEWAAFGKALNSLVEKVQK